VRRREKPRREIKQTIKINSKGVWICQKLRRDGDFIIKKTPSDCIVYMLHHTELAENGKLKAKTLGKMLDNQLTVEGLFSIVLLCQVEGSEHFFITNSDGSNPAKSPMDMFELKIDNDLKMVDTTIREYYELNKKENKKNADVRTTEG